MLAIMEQEFREWEGGSSGRLSRGKMAEGFGGSGGGHRDFCSCFTLGSLEEDECLSPTEYCHGPKARCSTGVWSWKAFALQSSGSTWPQRIAEQGLSKGWGQVWTS